MNSETRITGDDKENISTNRMMKTAKNIFGNKINTSSGNLVKMATVVNTPTNKELSEQISENTPKKFAPEHATPRANILIDKNGKNKISMLNFGKGKLGKNQRNS